MKNKPDTEILKAYLNGDCTAEEKTLVVQWLEQAPENIEQLEQLAAPNELSLRGFDKEKVKAELFKQIDKEEQSVQPSKLENSSRPMKRGRFPGWMRAAAIILIMVITGVAAYMGYLASHPPEIVYKKVTSPIRTVTALTLADGTRIQLNANSTLRYPETFSDTERVVYLEGEAFFSVAEDVNRPFRVRTGPLTTTALGTEFNVDYMPELEKIEVALVEGKVSVKGSGGNTPVKEVLLKPDQWVSYSPDNTSLDIKQGVENKILWRKGILEFEGQTIIEVIKTLENWYGVYIILENKKIVSCKVMGTFKDESLENILKVLGFIVGTEYSFEGDTVTLSGGSCAESPL